MRSLAPVLIFLAFSPLAVAEPFDGSAPMKCTALSGHDCLPDKKNCNRLKPEREQPPVLEIDVGAKKIKSPYRTALLEILQTTTNRESLVLQGSDLQFAWSALIHRKTGAMTVSIADRKGAYVIFGQCELASAPAAAPAAAPSG